MEEGGKDFFLISFLVYSVCSECLHFVNPSFTSRLLTLRVLPSSCSPLLRYFKLHLIFDTPSHHTASHPTPLLSIACRRLCCGRRDTHTRDQLSLSRIHHRCVRNISRRDTIRCNAIMALCIQRCCVCCWSVPPTTLHTRTQSHLKHQLRIPPDKQY